MTLLESLIALVILGLSAVGYLEVFGASARSVGKAESWDRAAWVAEASMESALLRANGKAAPGPLVPEGFAARVENMPWRGRVRDVLVTVTLPGGQTWTVHRLVRMR
jgi:type II secretory pathway pseudopilin PulG